MAIVATLACSDMSGRFPRCEAAIVARAAKSRRSVKDAVDMAALAIDRPVLPLKRKTRLDVIGDFFIGRNGQRLRRQ